MTSPRPQAVNAANEALETWKMVVRQIEARIVSRVPGPFKRKVGLPPSVVDELAQLLVAGVRSVIRDEQRRHPMIVVDDITIDKAVVSEVTRRGVTGDPR